MIGLGRALALLESDYGVAIDPAIKTNLEALTAIRDNAVHFINPGRNLSECVLEIGTAAVRNFFERARQWCKRELDSHNMYLLPIGFVGTTGAIPAVRVGADEQRLIDYLATVASSHANSSSPFHAALEVAITLKRSMGARGPQVRITRDPNAPELQVSDEHITKLYPWDYADLTRNLADRYIDFKVNPRYHAARKALKQDSRYVKVRLLDPGNPKGIRKEFYNPNIVDVLDRIYTRR